MTSNSGRRIDRLLPALTPRERAILVLRAWKAGKEPNRQILHSATASEAYEYNRIIDLLRAASDELTNYLVIIHLYTGQLEIKLSWFLTTLLWALNERKPERAEQLAEAVREGLAEGTALRWRELGALEAVLAEIAEEVDGEDVLHPDARVLFDETRQMLQGLHEEVTTRGGSCDLEPPSPEQVEALRKLARTER